MIKKENKYFVYILECADGTFYVGIAKDVLARIHAHNFSKVGARYTKSRRPVVLRYAEICESKSEALKREHNLKKLKRAEKVALIESYNPSSLSEDV